MRTRPPIRTVALANWWRRVSASAGTRVVVWPQTAVPIALLLCACSGTPAAEKTVGEHFRATLANIDSWCKEQRIGPYLDRGDPEYRRKVRATDCDILKLEPQDWRTEATVTTAGQRYPVPERWLRTAAGRFAHSVELPSPHGVSDVYRAGMSGLEYFQALCEAEAGEFYFAEVSNVAGFRIDRPQSKHPSGYRDLVFHTNEWSLLSFRSAGELAETFSKQYAYIEIRSSNGNGSVFLNFSGISRPAKVVDKPTAPYLVTWRGIRRPNDWEHGIYGQEIIVVSLDPQKATAVKRLLTRYEPYGTKDARDVFPRPCPNDEGRMMGGAEEFIRQALKPRGANSVGRQDTI